jgi:hypothetical protein
MHLKFPRPTRLGLIEARLTAMLPYWSMLGIRGLRASASLKLCGDHWDVRAKQHIRGLRASASLKLEDHAARLVCDRRIRGACASASLKPVRDQPKFGDVVHIRGVSASASLKLVPEGVTLVPVHRIRGVRVSASLKHVVAVFNQYLSQRHPRHVCLGLIEAVPSRPKSRPNNRRNRGLRASASLKQVSGPPDPGEHPVHPRRTRLGLIEATSPGRWSRRSPIDATFKEIDCVLGHRLDPARRSAVDIALKAGLAQWQCSGFVMRCRPFLTVPLIPENQ